MEKGDFEPSEKETVCRKDTNLDTNYKKSMEKSGLDSLLDDRGSLKINNVPLYKLSTNKEEQLTNKFGDGTNICSLEISEHERSRKHKTEISGKIVQYDREFLLACKDSPLTNVFPTEVEQFPEILIPINLPRLFESETWNKARRMSPKSADTSKDMAPQQSELLYGSDFEGFAASTENNTIDADTELLDFDFLLQNNVSTGQKRDNVDVNAALKTDNNRTCFDGLSSAGDSERDLDAEILGQKSAIEQSEWEEKAAGNTMVLTGEQNDLDVEGGQTNQEEMDLNIPTDVDYIDADDEDIPLREYQKELAKEGSEGENVIVLAPTNTGKTRVACSIIQVHLRRQRRSENIGKVVFLVENEALALQQGKVCAELLPAYRTKVISGSMQRDKKQFLKDFIDKRDILVVTAQVLLNALTRREINSLTAFSMIVFDECHHTGNLHSFNEIMSKYMDLKLRDNLDVISLPQVIGLTASLGVRGKTDASAAIDHMKGILANLDAKYLCTVRQNFEEMKLYENNPKEEIITAKNRQDDQFREAILHVMDDIDEYMRNHHSMMEVKEKYHLSKIMCQMSSSRGTEQFLQWRSAFKDAIARIRSDAARRMLNPCRLHLEVYNKALLIHADARIKDAEAILEEFMGSEMEIDHKDETDKLLINLYKNLKRRNFNDEPENPKLLEMQKLLVKDLGNNQDARGIVFVKSRELARALINWMHEAESMKTLNAREFVGQVASAAQGGMTKFGQKDVLEYFENGLHKVIVATSVADEGLDIPKCNLVIRYEYVTNEIVRLQSRGRARARNSKYYVLTTEGSWIVEKEEKNAMLERLMDAVVPALQRYIHENPNKWEKELRDMQEHQKLLEDMKQEQRVANRSDDDMEFRCLNCSQFICMSSDIRTILDSHHVVVNEEVNDRLVSVRGRNPVLLKDDIESRGCIFCAECQRKLGGICEYRRVEFPLIVIKNFMVVDKNGDGDNFGQWKKANIDIQQFSLDDFKQVVRMRRCMHVEE
ncbi:ATP-dependent RNA helicase DHX58-like isoform X2 [Mercenaria mercenaria]|uniref:ATP-dependent RNA helicase DHX58-like isoform X2 n=1 Tax=Mercenaria mercenaria TaxID=6596 RepID=UPI00234E87D0|nr:ATP-dependent RNA helicase DHX58-like isoform X2 [Mercenaria mercenaria]